MRLPLVVASPGGMAGVALAATCDLRDRLALRAAGEAVGVGNGGHRLAVRVPCSSESDGRPGGPRRGSLKPGDSPCSDGEAPTTPRRPGPAHAGREPSRSVRVGGRNGRAGDDREGCSRTCDREGAPPPAPPQDSGPASLRRSSHRSRSMTAAILATVRRAVISTSCSPSAAASSRRTSVTPAGRRVVRVDDAGKDPVCGVENRARRAASHTAHRARRDSRYTGSVRRSGGRLVPLPLPFPAALSPVLPAGRERWPCRCHSRFRSPFPLA